MGVADMNRKGYVKIFRKMLDSSIFQNEGLFKVWMWCLLKANHKDKWVSLKIGRGRTEILVKSGQFVFGRDSAANELGMSPSTVWKRIQKLEKLRSCDIQSNSHYSIITIINWESYQNDCEKVTAKVTTREQPGNTNKNDKNDKNKTPSEILILRERYSNQALIDQAFSAIASTRKSNRVAESVLLAQLKKWEPFPVAQVEAGIMAYLEKGYAGQGKREEYLMGIIRNGNAQAIKTQHRRIDQVEEFNGLK